MTTTLNQTERRTVVASNAPHSYTLRDRSNRPYASTRAGTVGGHKGLKIYGRLDCPNARRWIAKGYYVKHRVFFADESTARAAGYRPCGCCMRDAYKAWRESEVADEDRAS